MCPHVYIYIHMCTCVPGTSSINVPKVKVQFLYDINFKIHV